ncbi:MAG: dihydropteroate synthase [Bacteroidetes bacterium]|nr:dihydropteroate synthase [Bacteroidota bacterium]
MFTLNLTNKEILFKKPAVMGILNITPDSFYNKSRSKTIDEALCNAEKMIKDGATFIDIGGQSTRPSSELITVETELVRVLPVVEAIHQRFPETYISIDTFYSKVAYESVNAGACIINDISGGTIDIDMFETVAQLKVPYVCMHIKGTPQTMQNQTNYDNVVSEVYEYFISKIDIANNLSIKDFIVDIGFGFAKTTEQNFELLKNLPYFKSLDKPLLIGLSRKSSIYKTLGIKAVEALNGTTVLNTIAIQNGAAILRVHDVKEAVEVIELCNAIYQKDAC